jgi:hypothetical protein
MSGSRITSTDVVRGSVEETLNALLDAERIGCTMRNDTSAARHEPEQAGI